MIIEAYLLICRSLLLEFCHLKTMENSRGGCWGIAICENSRFIISILEYYGNILQQCRNCFRLADCRGGKDGLALKSIAGNL